VTSDHCPSPTVVARASLRPAHCPADVRAHVGVDDQANMIRLKGDGVPIVGFTWYSLTDQVDWDTTLRENNGTANAVGLYDRARRIRPAGAVYRQLVADGRNVLPAESFSQPAG
jgi:hypothetical protein